MPRKPKKQFAKVYPPCLDAYRITGERKDHIDFETFCEWLHQHALEWGEEGIGATCLRLGRPPQYGTDFVLCLGSFGDKKYALVGTDELARDQQRVIEWDWPEAWNVT